MEAPTNTVRINVTPQGAVSVVVKGPAANAAAAAATAAGGNQPTAPLQINVPRVELAGTNLSATRVFTLTSSTVDLNVNEAIEVEDDDDEGGVYMRVGTERTLAVTSDMHGMYWTMKEARIELRRLVRRELLESGACEPCAYANFLSRLWVPPAAVHDDGGDQIDVVGEFKADLARFWAGDSAVQEHFEFDDEDDVERGDGMWSETWEEEYAKVVLNTSHGRFVAEISKIALPNKTKKKRPIAVPEEVAAAKHVHAHAHGGKKAKREESVSVSFD